MCSLGGDAIHWIYGVYLMICTLQLPLCVILLARGFSVACRLLVASPDMLAINNTNNHTHHHDGGQLLIYRVVVHSLEPELCGMCVVAGMYATLYMVLTGLAADSNLLEQEEGRYYEPNHIDAASTGWTDDALRLSFWLFVWLQGWVQLCVTLYYYCPTHGGGDGAKEEGAELIERVWLLNAARLAALIGLCSSSPSCKRPFTQFLGWVVYVAWWVAALRDAGRYDGARPWLLLPQLGLDAVLRLGHRFDATTVVRVVLNSRLCFVTFSALWTQCSIMLLGNLSG
jgi:hypothetical protein